MLIHYRRGYSFSLILSLVLAACGATPTPPPPAAEILERSAQAMSALRSAHFVIAREGAPAYVDATQTFIFRRAEGDFVAPDSARAVVRVIGPALVTEVSVIAIGDQYWETNPLSGEWVNYSGFGYNPASLFNPDTGLAALMQNDLRDVLWVGLEELEDLPGVQLFHLTAAAPGEPVLAMTANLVGRGPVVFDWWIEPETYHVLRLRVTEPETDPADPTVWLIDFDRFDADLTVEPPAP